MDSPQPDHPVAAERPRAEPDAGDLEACLTQIASTRVSLLVFAASVLIDCPSVAGVLPTASLSRETPLAASR
jgi:hypothetical protein